MVAIKLTYDELRNNTFFHKGKDNFYQLIERKLIGKNLDTPEHLDCREIEVADNIQDYWWEYAKEELGAADWEIGMSLLLSGPKTNHDLADNCVIVFDGFIS